MTVAWRIVQSHVAGSPGTVSDILEDLIQTGIIKRRPSPRIRGGKGYLFSPSPRYRSKVVLLLKIYDDTERRDALLIWLENIGD